AAWTATTPNASRRSPAGPAVMASGELPEHALDRTRAGPRGPALDPAPSTGWIRRSPGSRSRGWASATSTSRRRRRHRRHRRRGRGGNGPGPAWWPTARWRSSSRCCRPSGRRPARRRRGRRRSGCRPPPRPTSFCRSSGPFLPLPCTGRASGSRRSRPPSPGSLGIPADRAGRTLGFHRPLERTRFLAMRPGRSDQPGPGQVTFAPGCRPRRRRTVGGAPVGGDPSAGAEEDPMAFAAILWVGCAGVIITAALRCRHHPEAARLGRLAVGGLYLVAGAVVNALFLARGEDYARFADGSYLPFVRHTWRSLVVPHHEVWIGLLIVFEAIVGGL